MGEWFNKSAKGTRMTTQTITPSGMTIKARLTDKRRTG